MEFKTQVEITDPKYLPKGGKAEEVCHSVIWGSRILREFLSTDFCFAFILSESSVEKMGMKEGQARSFEAKKETSNSSVR